MEINIEMPLLDKIFYSEVILRVKYKKNLKGYNVYSKFLFLM